MSLLGPKQIRFTVLSEAEEEAIIAFRRMPALLWNDIPNLTRSSLHRCLKGHGCSVLHKKEAATTAEEKFKLYLIGYFHIGIAEVQRAEGELYLQLENW